MTPLSKNPLPTVADEIALVLPSLWATHPNGPALAVFADKLAIDLGKIRRAAKEINADGRAWLMRRLKSREQFLVPPRCHVGGLRYCANCEKTFDNFYFDPNGKRRMAMSRTCSRSCAVALKWKKPGMREHMRRVLSERQSTPDALARIAAHNKRRWSDSEEHKRLSEQNRREWADPVKGALRAQSIKEVQNRPEQRKFYSDLRKQWWKDPVMRKKMHDAAAASQKTQAYREKLSGLAKERWRDPVWREKWTAANKVKSMKAASINRGRKQSRETIEKRVESTRRTKQLRAALRVSPKSKTGGRHARPK
jgi:hypothetical protein